MKRILWIALLLCALTGALVACGGSAEPPAQPAEANEVPAVEAGEEVVAEDSTAPAVEEAPLEQATPAEDEAPTTEETVAEEAPVDAADQVATWSPVFQQAELIPIPVWKLTPHPSCPASISSFAEKS